MNTKLKKGTRPYEVYVALSSLHYIHYQKIATKIGIPYSTIAPQLTHLRRLGLASFKGAGHDKRWRRHPLDSPLIPPQPDILKAKVKVKIKAKIKNLTPDQQINKLITGLNDLKTSIKANKHFADRLRQFIEEQG